MVDGTPRQRVSPEGDVAPKSGKRRGLPFAQVATNILRNPKISVPARLLYALMSSYADVKDRDGFTGRRRFANDMGVSMNTITRLLRELEKAGVVTRAPRYEATVSGKNRRTTDDWVLLDAKSTSAAKRGSGWRDGLEQAQEINASRLEDDRDPWAESAGDPY